MHQVLVSLLCPRVPSIGRLQLQLQESTEHDDDLRHHTVHEDVLIVVVGTHFKKSTHGETLWAKTNSNPDTTTTTTDNDDRQRRHNDIRHHVVHEDVLIRRGRGTL